jgi:hypothetical protein
MNKKKLMEKLLKYSLIVLDMYKWFLKKDNAFSPASLVGL